jgi:hypothetical protein
MLVMFCSNIDWIVYFLTLGCPLQASTRVSSRTAVTGYNELMATKVE